MSQAKCGGEALLRIWENKNIKVVKAKKIKKPFSWDTYGGNPHFPKTTVINNVTVSANLNKYPALFNQIAFKNV